MDRDTDRDSGRGPDRETGRDPGRDLGQDRDVDRDRDAEGRARNARPRDGLGRPLPRGATGVRRQPEGVARTPADTLAEAQRLLDDGMPFHAHEVFEDAWKSRPAAERELWRGLAQLAVGLTHLARGNLTGARALLGRGAEVIGPYRSAPPHGIAVADLVRWSASVLDGADAAAPPDAATLAPRLVSDGPVGPQPRVK